MDSNITVLVLELRRLMVNELLTNRHLYDGFFEDSFEQENYEQEVKKFLNQSYYDSNIGNAMPLAMARALSLPIVIYTSIKGCPVIYLSPENSNTEGTVSGIQSVWDGQYQQIQMSWYKYQSSEKWYITH